MVNLLMLLRYPLLSARAFWGRPQLHLHHHVL